MTKRIIIITPDGTETELTEKLTSDVAQRLVDGIPEPVRILRQSVADRYVYDCMLVNENGLLINLPRNQKATDLYLANVRRQYPNSKNPSKDAFKEMMSRYPEGTKVIRLGPEYEVYDQEPHIAGTAIWCDGYSVDEIGNLLYSQGQANS